MNKSGLITLFKLAPKIRAVIASRSEGHLNAGIMQVFQEEIPGFEEELGKAFTAYSQQGYLAAPLVNNPNEYRRTYFDWGMITLLKRSGITPTNYQLLTVDSAKFFIQYLITGGFKNKNLPVDNVALPEEFDEAKHFIESMKSM